MAFLIAIEGPDGVGKTSVIEYLTKAHSSCYSKSPINYPTYKNNANLLGYESMKLRSNEEILKSILSLKVKLGDPESFISMEDIELYDFYQYCDKFIMDFNLNQVLVNHTNTKFCLVDRYIMSQIAYTYAITKTWMQRHANNNLKHFAMHDNETEFDCTKLMKFRSRALMGTLTQPRYTVILTSRYEVLKERTFARGDPDNFDMNEQLMYWVCDYYQHAFVEWEKVITIDTNNLPIEEVGENLHSILEARISRD